LFVDTVDRAKVKRIDAIQSTIITADSKVKFDGVAGLVDAKQTLKEAVVFPMMYPQLFTGKSAYNLQLTLFLYAFWNFFTYLAAYTR